MKPELSTDLITSEWSADGGGGRVHRRIPAAPRRDHVGG